MLSGAMKSPSSLSSLKGITCTNDDPDACACCSGALFMGKPIAGKIVIIICCGKRICRDCNDSKRGLIGVGAAQRCSFCNTPPQQRDKEKIGALKKHAKKGAAWGQFHLGYHYAKGRAVSQSDYEAKRWYEKASKQGHPEATYHLACFFLEGIGGCSIDLAKARELAEKAISLESQSHLVDRCHDLLVKIAQLVDSKEAKSILVPLANEEVAIAQCELGVVFFNENDFLNAKRWFEAGALQGHSTSVFNALITCKRLKNMPETNFWFNIVSKPEMTPAKQESRKSVDDIGRKLRVFRDNCGECGADLEGDRRQYCSQCRTYCYCSRECQKLHWNRTGEGGHRDECMGVKLLEDKMATAQQVPHSVGARSTTSRSSLPPQVASRSEQISSALHLINVKNAKAGQLLADAKHAKARQLSDAGLKTEAVQLLAESRLQLDEVKRQLAGHGHIW